MKEATPPASARAATPSLTLRRLGIDTHQEPIIYMHADCPICRSEGFAAQSRVRVHQNSISIIATVNQVTSDLLGPYDAGLSESAWHLLHAEDGMKVTLSHPEPLISFRHVRGKIYGKPIDPLGMNSIIEDIAAGRYSDIQLASFITACASGRLSREEVVALTQGMIGVGTRIDWPGDVIVDKHSVGGLPGNRTTLIVVPIVAALGLTMPKTSSRAITSPAGTADTMETIAPVALSLDQMKRVVETEGGCIAWGGAVKLSPADDILIRVERVLDVDPEGQLVASILSKKAAAGSSHVVIDIPVGPTAKVRDEHLAANLANLLSHVGEEIGLKVLPVMTDGSQPVGRGIGPALEARDVLAVLRGEATAPADLRDRAALLAGRVLELAGVAGEGEGIATARRVIDDGRAYAKFEAICRAQGGFSEPPVARHKHVISAGRDGVVIGMDSRRMANVAKLAGAPQSPAAGIDLHVRLGSRVGRGAPLFTIHAESKGELNYSLAFVAQSPDIVQIEES